MLDLLDVCHAFVLLQRFRQRCRPRVTDVVAKETARIETNTQKKVTRDSVRPKREDATQVCAAVLRLRGLAY